MNYLMKNIYNSKFFQKGFTLIELLIVIGILAILTTVVIIVINPSQMIRQTRDVGRMSDLDSLNKALGLYEASGLTDLGSAAIVYISLPASNSNCSDISGLPTLPLGYTYHCSTAATYRNVDGTGWVPVNFTQISYGSPLGQLPIDPINTVTDRNYYTYVPGGSWHLATVLESSKYKLGGSEDKVSADSGLYPGLYEAGSNLRLIPVDYSDTSLVGYWKFEESSGTLYDSSGNNNNGTQSGGATYNATGKVGKALNFDGVDDYIDLGRASSIMPTQTMTISVWAKTDVHNPDANYRPIVDFYYGAGALSYGVDEDRFRITVSDSSQKIISTGFQSLSAWHNYVLTYNKAILVAYIDGIQFGTPVSSTLDIAYQADPTNNKLFVGKLYSSYPSTTYDGIIDEVRVYNRAFSAAEVLALYNATR